MMTKITLLYPAKTYGFDHLVLSLPTVELGGVHGRHFFFISDKFRTKILDTSLKYHLNKFAFIKHELPKFKQEALADTSRG